MKYCRLAPLLPDEALDDGQVVARKLHQLAALFVAEALCVVV